jgi:cytoskeletal protein RodZ
VPLPPKNQAPKASRNVWRCFREIPIIGQVAIWAVIVLLLLALIGGLTEPAKASKFASTRPRSSTSPRTTSTTTTTTPTVSPPVSSASTAPPTTTPTTTTTDPNGGGPGGYTWPGADLTFSQCVNNPNEPTTNAAGAIGTVVNVGGSITNTDTTTNDYIIEIAIQGGSFNTGIASVQVNDLSPGQTTSWATTGLVTNNPTQALTCSADDVLTEPAQ